MERKAVPSSSMVYMSGSPQIVPLATPVEIWAGIADAVAHHAEDVSLRFDP